MNSDNTTLQKIQSFLERRHILSLASCNGDSPFCCSVFYVYDSKRNHFVFASSDDTEHIKNITHNDRVAGTVHLDTDSIASIKGVQFQGRVTQYSGNKTIYYKRFPLSVAFRPKLWKIEIEWFKMTDNELGFGTKLIWRKL